MSTTLEVVAAFWDDPDHPLLADWAIEVVAPLYRELYPERDLRRVNRDNQAMLGFVKGESGEESE